MPKTESLSERLVRLKGFNIKAGEIDPGQHRDGCTPEDYCVTCENDCPLNDNNLNQTNDKSIQSV